MQAQRHRYDITAPIVLFTQGSSGPYMNQRIQRLSKLDNVSLRILSSVFYVFVQISEDLSSEVEHTYLGTPARTRRLWRQMDMSRLMFCEPDRLCLTLGISSAPVRSTLRGLENYYPVLATAIQIQILGIREAACDKGRIQTVKQVDNIHGGSPRRVSNLESRGMGINRCPRQSQSQTPRWKGRGYAK